MSKEKKIKTIEIECVNENGDSESHAVYMNCGGVVISGLTWISVGDIQKIVAFVKKESKESK